MSLPCLYLVAHRTQRASIVDIAYVSSAVILVLTVLLSTILPSFQQNGSKVAEFVYKIFEGSVERGVLLGGGISNFSLGLLSPMILMYSVGIFYARVSYLHHH